MKRKLVSVVGFLGLLTVATALLAVPVFGQYHCNNMRCAYVQCSETYWGFLTVPQNRWGASIRPGPCMQTCSDGPCLSAQIVAFADSYGKGVVIVEEVKQEEVATVANSLSNFQPASLGIQRVNFETLESELARKYGAKHRVHTVSGQEFNERVEKEIAKGMGCKTPKA